MHYLSLRGTMMRPLLSVAAMLLTAAACCFPAARAEEEGFQSLFDGKTLTGWHKNPGKIGHGTGGDWQVVDGIIVGRQDPPGSGNGGILLTDRKFADFELIVELMPDWGVDSGLFVRSNDKGQCFQMMVDYHENGNVGHIYGEGTGGFNNRPYDVVGIYNEAKSLVGLNVKPSGLEVPPAYSCTGPQWLKAWKIGGWNTAKVRVTGNPPTITTWINGLKVSEFNGDAYQGKGYDKAKVVELLGKEGSIALQVHGGASWPKDAVCRWRNIRIKPL